MKKIFMILKRIYHSLRVKLNYILNKNSHYKLGLIKRIYYAVKNFSVNEYFWYNFKENDYREYISEYERRKGRDINGEYKIVLDNKIIFEEFFKDYIKVPSNYAYISNKNIYPLHDFDISNKKIIEFIKNKKIVVLKILKGCEGKGVYIVKYLNNKFFINEEKITSKSLVEFILNSDDSIICEYMTQSKFENEIFDKSTNTIRIVCAKAKNEKYAHVIKAVQRIGCNASIPVDNLSAGGFASEINLETGELGFAIQKYRKDNKIVKYEKHPDTTSQIKGKVIPNWETIKNQIEELTNRVPYFKLIAWDVLLTDDGICIIEGNASSGCAPFQLEHGIRNEKYGDILKSYNVFK